MTSRPVEVPPLDPLNELVKSCLELRDAGAWEELRGRASVLREQSVVAGRPNEELKALQLIALAHRKLGHLEATIAAWDAVLARAPADARRLRSVACDNMANALMDVGRLDESLSRYAEALDLEDDAEGRAAIRQNRATGDSRLLPARP